ncbi:MAG: PmeII family type II restriction endonuclease [Dehalococcoidales bacterium]|jgi:hypothetical protein
MLEVDVNFMEFVKKCLDNYFKRKLELLTVFDLKQGLSNCNLTSLALHRNEMASSIVDGLISAHVNKDDEGLLNETVFEPVAWAYGRLNTEPTKDRIYRDHSGKLFWSEITGDSDFYLKLVRLMKDLPIKHREEYLALWATTNNRLAKEFLSEFCFTNGNINWEKLVQFVSEGKSLPSN